MSGAEPTGTRAYIGAGADITAGRVDVIADAIDTTTTKLLAVSVGAIAGAGGRADTVVDSDTEAFVGPRLGATGAPTTLSVTGSLTVSATSRQAATANLDNGDGIQGGGSGGAVAVGWLVADARVLSATTASIGNGVAVTRAGSVDVEARNEYTVATADVLLGSGGAVSIGGSEARATSAPSIRAVIGDGVSIGSASSRVTGDVTVGAYGRAEADSTAKVFGGGAVQVGVPDAQSTDQPIVDARVGTSGSSSATRIFAGGSVHVRSNLATTPTGATDAIQSADLTNDTLTYSFPGIGEGDVVQYVVGGFFPFPLGGLTPGNSYTVLDTATAGVIRLGSLFDAAAAIDPDRETIRFSVPHGFVTGQCVRYDPRGGASIFSVSQVKSAFCGGFLVRVIDAFTIKLSVSAPAANETPDVALGVTQDATGSHLTSS